VGGNWPLSFGNLVIILQLLVEYTEIARFVTRDPVLMRAQIRTALCLMFLI
jgi:hypothetical protein